MIVWTPISEMPDELRDGRDVLVWEIRPARAYRLCCYDQKWWSERGSVMMLQEDRFSHYSEINEPEGVANVPNCSR